MNGTWNRVVDVLDLFADPNLSLEEVAKQALARKPRWRRKAGRYGTSVESALRYVAAGLLPPVAVMPQPVTVTTRFVRHYAVVLGAALRSGLGDSPKQLESWLWWDPCHRWVSNCLQPLGESRLVFKRVLCPDFVVDLPLPWREWGDNGLFIDDWRCDEGVVFAVGEVRSVPGVLGGGVPVGVDDAAVESCGGGVVDARVD